MRYLIFFLLVLSTQIQAQDQIMYLNGDENYVDQIIEIQNDSLVYSFFKKTKKVPLTDVKGYYITIDTKENLKKRFYKREREYHKVDSLYHQVFYNSLKERGLDIDYYIQSCLPTDFSTLEYFNGFYITYDLDTIYTRISAFRDSDKNNVVFIAQNDSNDFEVYTPKLVKGYFYNNNFFKSYFPDQTDSREVYMFIRQEISGKINLFKKVNLPYHEGDYYLINKTGFDDYYHLCPYSNCTSINLEGFQRVMVSGGSSGETGYAYIPTKPNLDNSFDKIMPQLVYDCEGLANKIKNEFYTKADIVLIIKDYNLGCK